MRKENRTRRLAALACALLLCAACPAGRATDAAPAPDTPDSPFVRVAEAVLPCVVGVSNQGQAFNLMRGRIELVEQASGSGVVISAQGHIVTNYHVVEGAREVSVLHQGRVYPARIVGTDPLTDLAVLQVENAALPAAAMGDSDAERVGGWAIVVGNPLGQMLAGTMTVGIVSATSREVEGSIVKMIQTDAAINAGNSGGGLFNARGELIGIPSMKFVSGGYGQASVEGIGMAIPINVARPIIESIIAHGRMVRPRIGVGIATLEGAEEGAAGILPGGVYVNDVMPGGPADEAGLRAGDIILHADGQRVYRYTDLTAHLNLRAVGDTVLLRVYRIPGILALTARDTIPVGEVLELRVVLASGE